MPEELTKTESEWLEELDKRADTGGGGAPPVAKPPTGGGGDDDEDWDEERRGPRSRLKTIRVLVLFAFLGDLAAYFVLIYSFYAIHSAQKFGALGRQFVPEAYPIEMPPILYLNTAALVVSALTVEVARRRIFREIDVMDEWLGLGKPALKRAMPWLGATLGLGLMFLAGQLEAWRQLVTRRITFGRFATPASNFFYILTGFHLLHLVVGVVLMGCGVFLLPRLKSVEMRQIAVDSTGWFWMATCGMWVVIFGLLVFGQ